MREDAEQFPAQAHILFSQRQVLQRPINGEFQFLNQFIRLDDVLIGSQVERVDGRGHRRDSRNQNETRGIATFAEELEQFNARQVRHTDVADNKIVDLGFDLFFRRLAAGHRLDKVPVLAENNLQHLAQRLFIVHNQQPSHLTSPRHIFSAKPLHRLATAGVKRVCSAATGVGFLGNSSTNLAPSPGFDSTLIVPWSPCIIW
jgi:hypothetical protein